MFLENYTDVRQEFNYSKMQLYSMKSDIENNRMPEDKFSDYYSSESKSVERLVELADKILNGITSAGLKVIGHFSQYFK